MFRFIDNHPFISGFLIGFWGAGVLGKGIKKMFSSNITIIKIDLKKEPDGTVDNNTSIPKVEN
jgi:hypothetical protein